MTQAVNVPGVGTLQFPDGMSQPDMAAAIQKNFPQIHGPQASAPQPQGSFLGRLGTTAERLGATVAAPVEAAASLATGALAPAGAAAENLLTGHTSPQDYATARAKWQYTPTNPAAQMDIRALTAIPNAIIGPAMGWAGDKIQQLTGGRMSSQQAQDIGNTALMALPGVAGDATRALTKPAAVAPAVADATRLGLKLTPEQVANAGGGPGASDLARSAQGFSGSAKLERTNSLANAPKVDQIAARAVGAKSLSDADLNQAAAAPLAVYKAARGAGDVALDPNDFTGVKVPGTLKNQAIEDLRSHYANMGTIDASDLVSDLQELRAYGRKNMGDPFSPDKNAIGRAQLQAADALETSLDRHVQGLGDKAPISPGDLQNARTQLAKIRTVQDATDGGHLSLPELAKAPYLTGDLKSLADAHENFSRSFQPVNKVRDSGPTNFADAAIGLVAGLRHPLLASAALARPAMRSVLSSDLLQRRMAGRPNVQPRGLLGAAPGALNQQPQQGLLPNY